MRIVPVVSSALVAAALVVSAGCNSSTAPDPVDLTATVEYFTDVLPQGGTLSYTFVAPKNEYAQVTLLRVGSSNPRAPQNGPLTLTLGLSGGTTCDALQSASVGPALTAQIARPLPAATYCVEVTDEGTLTEPADVIIRVVHPNSLSRPDPRTLTSASAVTPGGAASLLFTTTSTGPVQATLLSLSPAATAGFGIGVKNPVGTNCLVSLVKEVAPGGTPQFDLQADPGDYCVQVFDPGSFQDVANYALRVTVP